MEIQVLTQKLRKLRRLAALAGAAMFAYQTMGAEVPRSLDADTIALPRGTVEGVLPNGLRYLLLNNPAPVGRVEFQLIWKVGSVQQDDSQGGCAHFLEHMAFGGSRRFPDRGAVGYLESLGMKYGIDINAFTGHDRTIYMFAAPSDTLRSGGYTKPLAIIRDWMDGLTINPSRVETEKGIILEELRSTFQEDPFYDLKIGQNRFSSRMPLGTADEINRMTADVLNEYYHKWYLPSLGAVVVVGDIDPMAVEKEIRRQFSSLKSSPDPGYRTYPLEYSPGRQLMADVDSLNNREEIEIIFPHEGLVTRTLADARRQAVGNIAVRALSRRLRDSGVAGDVSDNWYLGSTNHLVFSGRERRDMGIDSCVARISGIVSDILANGFDENEIRYHAGSESRRIGRYGSHSAKNSLSVCDDFADYVISGDRYLCDSAQVNRLQETVAAITPEEVKAQLSLWMADADSVMLVAIRTSPGKVSDRELSDVLSWWKHGWENPVGGYVFTEPVTAETKPVKTPSVLIEEHPYAEGQILSRDTYPSLGMSRYRLSNGITLLLKPTTDDGAALMGCVAPGGYSSLTPRQLALLGGAASYIDMGGIAKVPESLGDYMYQNDMALSSTIENDWHGFLGAFDTAKASEFFNLVYEKITAPQLLYKDFEEIRESMLEDVGKESILEKMLKRAPDRMLMTRMDELMGNTLNAASAADADPAMRQEQQRRLIQEMNLDSIGDFYRTLFGQPQGSTYIICGNFNPDSLARKFSGVFSRLQPVSTPIGGRINPLSLPDKTMTERFPNENPSQTAFDYLFFGEYEPGLRSSLVLKLMSNLLRNRIIADLREKRALVYSPYVALNYEGIPRGYFYYDINSSADNANMPQVHQALLDVIGELRQHPAEASELDAIKRSCIIAKRETLTADSPSAWRTTMISLLKNGESIADFDRYEEIIESITPEEVRDGFNRYINPELFVLLYMSDSDIRLK